MILASLFHDIGHYVLGEASEKMANLGVLHHEKIGAKKLLEWGFPEKIAALVQNHVNAKRYLTSKSSKYYKNLSEASKGTLEFQGGKMTGKEMKEFEESPYFKESLEVRANDERAKELDLKVPDLESYRSLLFLSFS